MRLPGDVPVGVGATTADLQALKKKRETPTPEPIKLSRFVGSIEHSVCQAQEIDRLNIALAWVKDQLYNEQSDVIRTITAVLDGEHCDVPGVKAVSWEALRP